MYYIHTNHSNVAAIKGSFHALSSGMALEVIQQISVRTTNQVTSHGKTEESNLTSTTVITRPGRHFLRDALKMGNEGNVGPRVKKIEHLSYGTPHFGVCFRGSQEMS